jgi:chorismate mutase/prephenate dehydratase
MHFISLGPKGTYSELVAKKLHYEKISYVKDIADICPTVIKKEVYRGVIPIENSTTGLILVGVDSINSHKQIIICAEVETPISFQLITNCERKKIRSFFVQKEAYQQCSHFILKHLSKAEIIFCNSNTETMKKFQKNNISDSAAIVPGYVGSDKNSSKYKQYQKIENFSNNTTRFFIVKKGEKKIDKFVENTKVSLYFEFQKDEPSLLYKVLAIFHRKKINLTMLSSRVLPHKKWTYGFFIDFQITDKKDVAKIPKILKKMHSYGIRFSVLGNYKNIAFMTKQELQNI